MNIHYLFFLFKDSTKQIFIMQPCVYMHFFISDLIFFFNSVTFAILYKLLYVIVISLFLVDHMDFNTVVRVYRALGVSH